MANFYNTHETIINLNGENYSPFASFDVAQDFVKIQEGGYSNDRKDKGNYICVLDGKGKWANGKTGGNIYCSSGNLVFVGTKYGISAPVLSDYYGRAVSVDEMKNLSYKTALKIYKNNFWDVYNLDRLDNQSVATMIYDSNVNQGLGASRNNTNRALKKLGINVPISETFNNDTISKMNSLNDKKLFDAIKEERINSYKGQAYEQAFIKRVLKIPFEFAKKGYEFAKKNKVAVLVTLIGLAGLGFIIYKKYVK